MMDVSQQWWMSLRMSYTDWYKLQHVEHEMSIAVVVMAANKAGYQGEASLAGVRMIALRRSIATNVQGKIKISL